MKRDKKTNRSGAITLLLSVLLIAGISAVMVLYLRGLQEGDSGYTPVEPMQEAESTSDAEVPVDGTVDETLPEATGVQEQQANDTEVGAIFAENLAAAKEDRIALQEELEPGKVIREFTVDNQKFYLVKNGATNPEEATVSAEDAAAIALESWKEMFPENEWEGPFRIQLSYMQANFLYGEMPAQAMNLWFVDTIIPLKANNTNISMAIIHPESRSAFRDMPTEDNANLAMWKKFRRMILIFPCRIFSSCQMITHGLHREIN